MPHLLIISSPYYESVSNELIKGASDALHEAGATYEIIEVPGAFEIPAAVRFAITAGKFDGYVALGCVIRGETTHYDYVCQESARGLNDLALHYQAAIGYGILTVENEAQAFARARSEEGNKGADAARAALAMIALKERFGITGQLL